MLLRLLPEKSYRRLLLRRHCLRTTPLEEDNTCRCHRACRCRACGRPACCGRRGCGRGSRGCRCRRGSRCRWRGSRCRWRRCGRRGRRRRCRWLGSRCRRRWCRSRRLRGCSSLPPGRCGRWLRRCGGGWWLRGEGKEVLQPRLLFPPALSRCGCRCGGPFPPGGWPWRCRGLKKILEVLLTPPWLMMHVPPRRSCRRFRCTGHRRSEEERIREARTTSKAFSGEPCGRHHGKPPEVGAVVQEGLELPPGTTSNDMGVELCRAEGITPGPLHWRGRSCWRRCGGWWRRGRRGRGRWCRLRRARQRRRCCEWRHRWWLRRQVGREIRRWTQLRRWGRTQGRKRFRPNEGTNAIDA